MFSEVNGVKDSIGENDCIMIWNLVPSNFNEAKSLIPSLATKHKEEVEAFIEKVNKYKN